MPIFLSTRDTQCFSQPLKVHLTSRGPHFPGLWETPIVWIYNECPCRSNLLEHWKPPLLHCRVKLQVLSAVLTVTQLDKQVTVSTGVRAAQRQREWWEKRRASTSDRKRQKTLCRWLLFKFIWSFAIQANKYSGTISFGSQPVICSQQKPHTHTETYTHTSAVTE